MVTSLCAVCPMLSGSVCNVDSVICMMNRVSLIRVVSLMVMFMSDCLLLVNGWNSGIRLIEVVVLMLCHSYWNVDFVVLAIVFVR